MRKIIIKILLISSLICMPHIVWAQGGIKVVPQELHIPLGSSASFDITAQNAVGKIGISSSDSQVAAVIPESTWVGNDVWIENETITVNVSGKKVGSAVITVVLKDVADSDEEKMLTGTYEVVVSVDPKQESVSPTIDNHKPAEPVAHNPQKRKTGNPSTGYAIPLVIIDLGIIGLVIVLINSKKKNRIHRI